MTVWKGSTTCRSMAKPAEHQFRMSPLTPAEVKGIARCAAFTSGTEPQRDWARDIRKEKLRRIERVLKDMAQAAGTNPTEQRRVRNWCADRDTLKAIRSPGFWIDQQHDHVVALLGYGRQRRGARRDPWTGGRR